MVAENRRPGTLMAAMRYFNPETAANYIAGIKWPDGSCCPKCGSTKVGTIPARARFQCREKGCRRQFSLTTGTIMEATHLGLDQWCAAVWMIVTCRNGVSSCEIARTIGCKQQSAWHLLHRIRFILRAEHDRKMGKHGGVVEADSTYVGGSVSNMSYERQQKALARLDAGKAMVSAIRERRGGFVRAAVMNRCGHHPNKDFLLENVEMHARVYTDCGSEFKFLDRMAFHHKTVNHSALEYARGTVHVNGLECFFNCLRRGLKGTYVATSNFHLGAYVDEAVFRFNHRHDTEWERFDRAMRMIVGKRLTYTDLTDGATR